jgi:hypothetical protein
MILEIDNTNGILIFFSGVISGLIAHLKGDNRFRWFLMGFAGLFGPLISALFSERSENGKKKNK